MAEQKQMTPEITIVQFDFGEDEYAILLHSSLWDHQLPRFSEALRRRGTFLIPSIHLFKNCQEVIFHEDETCGFGLDVRIPSSDLELLGSLVKLEGEFAEKKRHLVGGLTYIPTLVDYHRNDRLHKPFFDHLERKGFALRRYLIPKGEFF